jgi:hypothetical protein
MCVKYGFLYLILTRHQFTVHWIAAVVKKRNGEGKNMNLGVGRGGGPREEMGWALQR